MKTKIWRIIKIVCFCMVAVLMISEIGRLLKPKWLENRWASAKTNNSFYELEDNSTDVIFFGASVISAAIDPYQLYDEHGISSYNLGVMSQPMLATYYWFKEALETQNMKLAVIEIKSAGKPSEKAEEKARKSYDYMKWGKNKVEYALEYKKIHSEEETTEASTEVSTEVSIENSAEKSTADKTTEAATVKQEETKVAEGETETEEEVDLWSYLFPLSLYHTRWSELSYDDYDFYLGNNYSRTRGLSVLSTRFKDSSGFDAAKEEKGKYDGFDVDTTEMQEANPTNMAYANKIIELAKEKNVQLLFVKMPDESWDVDQHNLIQKLADKNNIKFLDFNIKSYREKIKFDYSEDAADSVHSNIAGAEKITKYMGKYLSENYKLTDYRKSDNSVKKTYESGRAEYEATIKNGKLSMITGLDEYLKAINDDEYTVIITSGSNVNNIVFNNNQKKLLLDLGVEERFFVYKEFGKNIISVLDGKTKVNRAKKQSEEKDVVTQEGGTISDGTTYSITANAQGCSVRLNDSEYKNVNPYRLNIVVYDKKLHEVADSVSIYASGNNPIMYRGE